MCSSLVSWMIPLVVQYLLTKIALIFYYGATLVRYNQFTVDDITAVNSVLLFSLAYASTVMTWSTFFNLPALSTPS